MYYASVRYCVMYRVMPVLRSGRTNAKVLFEMLYAVVHGCRGRTSISEPFWGEGLPTWGARVSSGAHACVFALCERALLSKNVARCACLRVSSGARVFVLCERALLSKNVIRCTGRFCSLQMRIAKKESPGAHISFVPWCKHDLLIRGLSVLGLLFSGYRQQRINQVQQNLVSSDSLYLCLKARHNTI
jgi:hypothetical protein